jgi:hypothetical protein
MSSYVRTLGKEHGTHLINEVLTMIITQLLCPDDPMEISLHELLDEVDLLEALEIRGTEDIEDGDDVLVVEVAEELDFAEGAETEHGVVEGSYALDCDAALGGDV